MVLKRIFLIFCKRRLCPNSLSFVNNYSPCEFLAKNLALLRAIREGGAIYEFTNIIQILKKYIRLDLTSQSLRALPIELLKSYRF